MLQLHEATKGVWFKAVTSQSLYTGPPATLVGEDADMAQSGKRALR